MLGGVHSSSSVPIADRRYREGMPNSSILVSSILAISHRGNQQAKRKCGLVSLPEGRNAEKRRFPTEDREQISGKEVSNLTPSDRLSTSPWWPIVLAQGQRFNAQT
jgi:hypothetical protein